MFQDGIVFIDLESACSGAESNSRAGDRALAALLLAHGLIMNGGVLHAVECLTSSQLSDAGSGYRFFGFDTVAPLLTHARQILEAGEDLERQEPVLDRRYAELISGDSVLMKRFQQYLSSSPSDFAPL